MTAIVGLLCKEGAVIGCDSSTTFTVGRTPLIEQRTRKLRIIDDRYVLAGTGQVGLGQRFCDELEQFVKQSTNRSLRPVEFCTKLSQIGLKNFTSTGYQGNEYGALLAFHSPPGEQIHLCEFETTKLQPELKSDNIWYVSMGSGQVLTDPFLGFIRKLFWNDGKPSLSDGIFATYWCLQHAIDVNAGGINGPIDIAVLEKKGSVTKARCLSEDELQVHKDNVKELEKHISIFKALAKMETDKEVPKFQGGSA